MRRGFLVGAAVVVIALAGCANPGEVLAEKVIEQGLSQDGTKVDIDADGDGGVTVEYDEGGMYQAGAHASVPDDFPSELPLPDAALTTVVTNDGGFLLSYGEVDRATFDSLAEKIKAAGFEQVGSVDMEGLVSLNLENDVWAITLGLLGEGADGSMTYGVYARS